MCSSRTQNKFHEAVVNLDTQTVEYNVRLGANMHAPGDGEEIFAIERVCLEDQGVQDAIAKLELPQGSKVVIDPWIYGIKVPRKLFQCARLTATQAPMA